MRLVHVVLVVVVALVVIGSTAVTALAAPGDLDPSFGLNGIAMTSFGPGVDRALHMLVLPDGRYVVAGVHISTTGRERTLVRFLADGTLDASFGDGGKVVVGPGDWSIEAMKVAGDGRLFIVANTGANPIILSLLADGRPDTSFGSTGEVRLLIVASDFYGYTLTDDSVALLPDGSLALAGTRTGGFSNDLAVLRLLPSGATDLTYGTGGMASADVVGGSYDQGQCIGVAGDGSMLVGGSVQSADAVIARFTPSGALDTSFASKGFLVVPGAGPVFRLTASDDGGWIVTTNKMRRISANGQLDASYGIDGIKTLPFSPLESGVAVQPDGMFLRVGIRDSGYPTYDDVAVSRYYPDGTLDYGFGANGSVITDLGGADDFAAAALGPDGKLVVAGYSYPSGATSAAPGRMEDARTVGVAGMGLVRYLCGPSTRPSLAKLSPISGRRGITVTITGKNFRSRRGTSYVKFGTTKVGKYVSWSNTRIKVRVPAKAKFGRLKVTVQTPGGASNTRTFTVKR